MPYITINLDTMEYRHSVGIPSEISTNEFYFEISEKEIEKVNNKIKTLKWDSSRCLNFLLKCFYSRLDTTYHVVHFCVDTSINWVSDLENGIYNNKMPYHFKRLKIAKRKLEESDEYKEMFCLENHAFLIIPSAFKFQFIQMVNQNFPEIKDGDSYINNLPSDYGKSFLKAIKKRNRQIINLLINL